MYENRKINDTYFEINAIFIHFQVHTSIVLADLLSTHSWHLIEADPCFSFLDVLQLFHDFFFGNAMALSYFPELSEFSGRDLTIAIKVYLVKKFTRR